MPKPGADRQRGGGPQSAPWARGAEPHRGSLARRAALFVAGLSWVRNVALSTPVVRNVARRIGGGAELDAGLAAMRAYPDLQASLVRDGYMVRCYVPYGGQWYAYVLGCVRRLPGGALQRLRERTGQRCLTRGAAVTTDRNLALAAKRGMDVTSAALGIVVVSPVLAWTALAALVAQGPPILFRQERPGLAGEPFTMLKFRTMRPPRRGEARYGTDRQRMTRLGRLLRSTSIDELPQLWNVLRGDMSLVGPRALLAEYLDRYTPEEQRRHDMRPGITSWALVNGRHTLRFEDRLALDVWYVDNWSLWLDLKILAVTARQVLRRTDVVTTQDLAAIDFPARFQSALTESGAGRR